MAPEDQLEAMWRDHAAAVFAFASRRTSSTEDAWDVVSETYLTAWRRIREIPDASAVRPWLFVTARHVIANQARGRRRRSDLAERVASHAITHPINSDAPEAPMVRDALARLSLTDRELVELVSWDGLTPSQAAIVLGISPTTARVRLHRARGRLRDHLLELGIQVEPDDAQPARTPTAPDTELRLT